MPKWRVNFRRFLLLFLAICDQAKIALPISLRYSSDVINLSKFKHVREFVQYYGYPGEEYTVQTRDGYLLEVQRIPNFGGPPILLMHGLRGSAMNWVMMGPWSDLAYLLHDNGYDVWLANSRGTRFGRKHIKFQANQPEFWNFSMHEIGLYDASANIDFVLKKNGSPKLSYVGHSQGAAALYILTSLRPEYNEKIKIMHSVAPAVYMRHLRSQFKTLARYYLKIFQYPYLAEAGEINYNAFCHSNIFTTRICFSLFATFYGPSEPGAINMTMTPVLLSNFPETCSIRQIAHYYQIHETDRFARFDYDFSQNRRVVPPALYPLSRVSIRNAIYYCGDDYLVDAKDVKRLITKLSNVVETVFVQKCSHLDPLVSTKARKQFHERILQIDRRIKVK